MCKVYWTEKFFSIWINIYYNYKFQLSCLGLTTNLTWLRDNYSHCLKWQIKKAYSAQCWSSHICLTTWHHLFLEFWLVQCSVVVSTNGRFFDVVVPNAYYIKLLIALQVVTLRFGRASRSFKKRDTSTLKNSAETKYKQNKKLHLQQNNKSW